MADASATVYYALRASPYVFFTKNDWRIDVLYEEDFDIGTMEAEDEVYYAWMWPPSSAAGESQAPTAPSVHTVYLEYITTYPRSALFRLVCEKYPEDVTSLMFTSEKEADGTYSSVFFEHHSSTEVIANHVLLGTRCVNKTRQTAILRPDVGRYIEETADLCGLTRLEKPVMV